MPLVITHKDSSTHKDGRTRKDCKTQTGRAAPDAAPAPKTPVSIRAARARHLASLRRISLGGCGLALAGLGLFEGRTDPKHFLLFLFVSGLAGLAALVPATGPHGQRVGLLPAVGLAALLLLPPFPAFAPLLASAGAALVRSAAPARRQAWERGACLGLALLFGIASAALLPKSFVGNCVTAAVYCAVFAAARRGMTARHSGAMLRVGRQSGRLETATLVAAAPVALLMAAAFPMFGLVGLAGASVLLGLLGLVAHFGFEVAGLRGQVSAMEKLSAVTVSQTSAARVTEQFLALSRGLVSCDRAVLWLTDDTDMRLKRTRGRGESSSETVSVRFGEGLAGRAAERKTPLLVRDGASDPRAVAEETCRSKESCALLLLPLVAGDQTFGVAQFERDAPGVFSRRDSGRLEALASQAAATLANVRAHQDIYSQATTDALTGLFNRRHLQTVLADERRRAERYGHPLSVIMLDVDGFKSYNDTYGHVQGDVLLKTLAGILQNSVRNVDSVGRFGGEEFVVVLPETPADEAYRAAERLRLAVAETVFPGFADDPELAVWKTISLGVATYPDITQDTQALVTLADNALYRAKRGGRNRTVQAGLETAL